MGGIAGNDDNRKQNHCEIEKRRRDKMNHYITELASVIPAFNTNQSRLDKLTVLRMAVQHVKSLRSSLCSFSSFHLRPSFLSSGNLLKNLILQMASQEAQDNLFMVVTCDRGKVLFVSKSSKDILNQDQSELVGQSLFDILHKDDVSKVKEQISYFNLMPKEMLVDSKTLQPIKSNQRESFIQLQNQSTSNTLQPGSRRSFFCRMKSGRIWPPNDQHSSKSQGTPSSSSPASSSSSCKESKRAPTNYQGSTTADSQQHKHHKHEQQQQQTMRKGSQKCQEIIQTGRPHQRENRAEKNKQTSSSGKSNKSYKRNERHLSHNYHNQQERQQSCDFEKSNSVYSSGSGKSSGGGGQSSSGSDSSSGISSAPASSGSGGGSSSDNSKASSGGGGGGGGSIQCCAKMTKKSRDRERSRDRNSTAAAAAAKIVDKSNHHGKSSKTKHVAARGNHHHHHQRETSSRGLGLPSADGGDDRKQSSARVSSGSHVNAGDGASERQSAGSGSGGAAAADRNVIDNGGLDSHGSSLSGHSSAMTPSQDDGGEIGERGSSATTNKSSPLSSSSPQSSSSSTLSPLSASSGGDTSVDKNNAECDRQTAEGGANEDPGAEQTSSRESSMSTTGGTSNDDSGNSSSGSAGTNSISLSSSNRSNNGGGVYNRKQWRYVVMHCSGYLKSITLRNDEYDSDDFDEKTGANSTDDSDDDDNADTQNKEDSNFRTVNCLVAVCRRSVLDRDLKPDRPLTFTCRYSMEGKFTFVDQRTTVALGYTPQQLMGTSHYAYCHKDSVNTFKECHRQCILKSDTVSSDIYQFKRANGQHLWLQTSLKSFRNPWTKFIDYIVANHTTAEGNDPRYNEGCVPTKFNRDMTCEANSQSSSPASSSSAPSEECKKSTSPSSSSIGSSYSMDSYASSGSIQALLNNIDRVKSGGLKHSLEFPKKRSGACHNHNHNHNHHHRNHHHTHHNHRHGDAAGSSGGSSTRKSTNDSGNYSDVRSCSSISSQNSGSLASSGGFTQTVNNFVNQASNVSLAETTTSATTNETTTTTGSQSKQRPPPQPAGTKSLVQIVVNPNDTRLDSTGSYQFGSQHKQEPKEVSSGFKPAQAEANSCGRQQGFESQRTICQPVICGPPVPNQQVCVQRNFAPGATNLVPANPSNGDHEQQFISTGPGKAVMGGPRMITARVNRAPSINSTSAIKPLQRPYQYSYRAPQMKPGQMSAEGAKETSWSSQAPTYGVPCAGVADGPVQVVKSQAREDQVVSGEEQPGRQQQHAYVMQPQPQHHHQQQQQQMTAVNVIQVPQNIQSHSNSGFSTHMAYQDTFPQQQVGPSYINPAAAVDARYGSSGVSMGHSLSQVQDNSITRMSMGGQQQASQQGQQSNDMGIPMIWNSSDGTYPNMVTTTTTMHNSGQQQIDCHQVPAAAVGGSADMVGMDVVVSQTDQMGIVHHHSHCHQCAGHKCCAMGQSMMMASNNASDFNSMHLSSLAVDDLDESELLECLAACDPDSQIYNMQNNTYSQYNAYGGQQ